MDRVLQLPLLSTLAILALVLAGVAIWRSLRRSRSTLIIFVWCAGGFAAGTWFVTSLHGRATGNLPLVLALVGIIAAAVGQLTRHHKDRIATASLLPRVKRSTPDLATEDRPRVHRIRRGNHPRSRDWNWARGLWCDGVISRRSVLIVFTVGATLAAIL